jgi:hypothetical protein
LLLPGETGTLAREVKIAWARRNVVTLTATSQELSALIAAGRMALEVMEEDPRAPAEAKELLGSVLRDYDRALARLQKPDGRSSRPPENSPGTED